MDHPPLPEPPAPDPDATFERIWETRDEIVRQVWGYFDAVFVHRDAGQMPGGYVYVSEIAPPCRPAAPPGPGPM